MTKSVIMLLQALLLADPDRTLHNFRISKDIYQRFFYNLQILDLRIFEALKLWKVRSGKQ